MQLERRLARPILSTLIQDLTQSEAVDERHGEEDDSAVQVEPQVRLALMVWATERLCDSEPILSRSLLGCCESV